MFELTPLHRARLEAADRRAPTPAMLAKAETVQRKVDALNRRVSGTFAVTMRSILGGRELPPSVAPPHLIVCVRSPIPGAL